MPLVQMNTRIDKRVKADGDAVFARLGMTPSDVVRAIWEYAAEHGDAPAIVKDAMRLPGESADQLQKSYKQSVAQTASQLVAEYRNRIGAPLPDALEAIDYRSLREEAWEQKLAERGLA